MRDSEIGVPAEPTAPKGVRRMNSPDTSKKAQRLQIRVLRVMGAEGRLESALALGRNARSLLEGGVRMRHPDYDDEQVNLATKKLILGQQLYAIVHPHTKDIEP